MLVKPWVLDFIGKEIQKIYPSAPSYGSLNLSHRQCVSEDFCWSQIKLFQHSLFCFLQNSSGMITAILRLVDFLNTDLLADQPWNPIEMLQWMVIEPGIYFIAACLPSLGPLFRSISRVSEFGTIRARLRSYIFKMSKQANDPENVSLDGIHATKRIHPVRVGLQEDFNPFNENRSLISSADNRSGFMI